MRIRSFMVSMIICMMLLGCAMTGKAEMPEAESAQTAQAEAQSESETGSSEEGSASAESETEASAAGQTNAAPETNENGYPVFNFDSRTVKLNSGYEMPILNVDIGL